MTYPRFHFVVSEGHDPIDPRIVLPADTKSP